MGRRVVVTGMGPVTPIGTGNDRYWAALAGGKSGISQITRFDAAGFSSRIAGEVKDFDPLEFLDSKVAKRMDRFTQFAVAATRLALEDARLSIKTVDPDRIGVIIGSGIGGLGTLEEQHTVLVEKGPRRVSPFLVPMMIADMASGQVSIVFRVKGPNFATVSACSSGAHAIGEAYEAIRRGAAEVMIAGGAEAPVTPLSVAAFSNARALSTRNDEPERASRPFDIERDGFVIAEGSGVLILEDLDFALARGAGISGEITGYAATADAYHITQPDPEGAAAAAAMRLALERGGLRPADVDYINAHGTSTLYNDEFETLAIKRVFGEDAYRLAVSSTKSMTGHLLGAAGAIETIACLLGMRHGIIPPTINLEHPDPLCDLDYVAGQARHAQVDVALSNSFGFGGHNVTLALKRFEGSPEV